MVKFYKRRYRVIKYVCLAIAVVTEILITMCYLNSAMPASRYWIATSVVILALLCILILMSGDCMDLIKQFCETNGYNMKQLEEEFQHSTKVSANIRKGQRFIFAINEDGRPDIADMQAVSHMEFNMELRGRSRKGIAYIYCCDGKIKKIPCAKKNFEILKR